MDRMRDDIILLEVLEVEKFVLTARPYTTI